MIKFDFLKHTFFNYCTPTAANTNTAFWSTPFGSRSAIFSNPALSMYRQKDPDSIDNIPKDSSLKSSQGSTKVTTAVNRKLSGKTSFLPRPHIHFPTGPTTGSIVRPRTPGTKHHQLNTTETLVCGFVAGCMTRTCVAPLDVGKIALQLRGSAISNPQQPHHYSNCRTLSSIIKTTYALEGLVGLWKGNAAGCCRLAPYSASKFLVYDTCKRTDKSKEFSQLTPSTKSFLYGALAGMVATVVTYPMELLRTLLIIQPCTGGGGAGKPYSGIAQGLVRIYQTGGGVPGLYRGVNSALVGVMPFEGIQFAVYEALKDFRDDGGKRKLRPLDYLAVGSVSGFVAQTVTYPLDSIKKRLQAQVCCSSNMRYRGMVHCAKTVLAEEGLGAFYRGIGANVIRILPYSAIMFTSYEYIKKLLIHCNDL